MIFNDVADHRWAARTRLSMAGVHRRQCEWAMAHECADAALTTFGEIGDQPAEAGALWELGLTLRGHGEFDRSSEMLASSLAIFQALGDAVWSARVLASTARLAAIRGDDAAPFLQEANETCRRAGIPSLERIAVVLREW